MFTKQTLLKAVIPVTVLLIASIQMAQALGGGNLTSWKGGGFGMFGDTESTRMRFLEAEGLSEDGTVMTLRPHTALTQIKHPFHSNLRRRIKAKPDRGLLEYVGKKFLESNFVLVGTPEAVLYPDRFVIPEEFDDNPELRRKFSLETYNLIPETNANTDLYTNFRLREVRLQAWRYDFDAKNGMLFYRKIGEPVEVTRP